MDRTVRSVVVDHRHPPLFARHTEPDRLVRTPTYRPGLVDPFRGHLRERREQDPAVPVTRLLAEIRERGYAGSANLLVRYINSGRAVVSSDLHVVPGVVVVFHPSDTKTAVGQPG
ncbi:hypothetical protein P8605_00470 [Streptomyces sp. T-3]|nr:hypothetical protein [Streptomyces sp. T-3]